MVARTVLAEEKRADPFSEQVSPAPGASTHSATPDDLSARAAPMSRAIAAASAARAFDTQATAGPATGSSSR